MTIGLITTRTMTNTAIDSVYSSPTGITTTVANAVLTNASSTTQDVSIYIRSGSTDTLISTVKLKPSIGYSVIIKELIGGINSGNIIRLSKTSASPVNITLYGKGTNS